MIDFSNSVSTFRDPKGKLHRNGDHIVREIFPEHVPSVLAWLQSPLAEGWVQQGRMVTSKVLAPNPGEPAWIEHEPIFFPSFPWEWTLDQWIDAALLTIDLCEEAINHGYILKDATPLNILFRGPRPVFVDVLSFEHRDPQSPLWKAYAQFQRTFILPICAYIYLGWPLSATQQCQDGYEPADLAPYLSAIQRWSRPFFSLVTLPLLLEKTPRIQSYRPQAAEDMSAFALHHLLRKTRKLLHFLPRTERTSRWSHYPETAHHYELEDHQDKRTFVRSAMDQTRPRSVLDVGANTGVYSRIAAESGADVVAWDSDVQATTRNWKTANTGNLSILPLIANFARPTPAVGWRNKEYTSLLDRAKGRFECVLMLGILHHLLITDQIPLSAICEQLWDISIRWAILEWIPQQDSQFDELCRGRQELFGHLSEEYFIDTLAKRFVVRSHTKLRSGRSLWLVERA
jgi:hypothetical protein